MKILIEIDDSDVKSIAQLAGDEGFESFVTQSIKRMIYVKKQQGVFDQQTLLDVAIWEAFMQDVGESFTLKDLLGDMWYLIESPREFYIEFRKSIESDGFSIQEHRSTDGQTIYRRDSASETVPERAIPSHIFSGRV